MVEGLRDNLNQMKEIVRELYVFTNQAEYVKKLESDGKTLVDDNQKLLLQNSIVPLISQLKILNNSIPSIVGNSEMFKPLSKDEKPSKGLVSGGNDLRKIQYNLSEDETVNVVISEEDRDKFLETLSKSRLSINKLKKKYSAEKKVGDIQLRKPNSYAKISNKLFRNLSNKFVDKGYFKVLNRNLRKINSRFVIGSYVSMILFTVLVSFIVSLFLLSFLLFFEVSALYPFISLAQESILIRFIKFVGIVIALPLLAGFVLYFYPHSEAKNLGARINQELPFVTIHMSSVASSGIEPVKIFEIILKGGDYKYASIEFKKLMNLINFHGEDIVSALKKVSISSPSTKLKDLLNGLAITITSGGNLHNYLSKHSEIMLFDYKLEREKYTKISETFMDIYISIAIAAPMILLMIFVIIGSTGLGGGIFNLGLSTLSFLLILMIVLLNVFFLVFLKLKQPTF